MAIGTPYAVCAGGAAGGATTFAVTVSHANTAGDCLAAFVTVGIGSSQSIVSVSDPVNGTWPVSAPSFSANGVISQWFLCPGALALTTSQQVTATFGNTTASRSVEVFGISGVTVLDTATPTTNSGGATHPTATTPALSQASEIVLAGTSNAAAGGSPSWSSPFTIAGSNVQASTNQWSSVSYDIVSSTTAVTPQATITAANWAINIISVKATGIGTPYLIGGSSVASGSSSISVTLSGSTATSQDDAIIVSGGCSPSGSATAPVSCTDTQNNPYALVNSQSKGGTFQFVSLGSSPLSTTGNGGNPDKITVTFDSGNTQAKVMDAVGCAGIATVSALDQAGVASGSSASPSVATPAQIQSGDMAIAVITYSSSGGLPTWGGGFTGLVTTSSGSNPIGTVAYQAVSGTSAATASATLGSGSVPWAAGVITLSAGQNVNAGSLNATVGFCASITAQQAGAGALSSTISFSASLNNTVSIVKTWTAKATGNYGLLPLAIGNTSGHALIAFAAWNDATVNPVSNIADDAHNWWVHLGTSSVSGDVRCSIWIAPNAQAATNLSLGLTWFAQGVTLLVAELAGFADYIVPDGAVVTAFSNSATSLTLTGNTGAQGDLVLGMVAGGNNNFLPAIPASANVKKIGQVSVNDPNGAGGPADTSLTAFWATAPAAATPAVTTTTTSTAIPLAGVLSQLNLTPAAPVQKNPSMPAIHVETAFGYQPGDPTTTPTWTDITARYADNPGEQAITSSRGRQYESESPETGDLVLNLVNEDGSFTPGNSASPYYPDVLLGTATRVWATWAGRHYAIAAGYTERIPQTWPDPQWGTVPWEAPDALDPLSNSQLPSALAGEILSDAPYMYIPCGDTYIQNEASGQPLSNLARTNTRPMICEDGVQIRPDGNLIWSRVQTGLAWQQVTVGQVVNFRGNLQGTGLTGDPATGAIGVNTGQGDTAIDYNGGAYYAAPDLPQPGTTGFTIEFWASVTGLQSASHYQELLRISGPANNYFVGAGGGSTNAYARGARFLVRINPGPAGTQGQDFLYVDLVDFEGNDSSFTFNGAITDGVPHHFVFVIQSSGGNYRLDVYLDGAHFGATKFSSGVNIENDWSYIGVGGVQHNDGGLSWGWNFSLGHLAVFGMPLTAARIAAHYQAGNTGGQGDDTVTRVAKLFTWGGFGLRRACAPPSPSPQLGPADQIQGQSVVDAVSSIASEDGGMLFCDAAGNVTWWPRTFLYNRAVKWVFGDNPANGETPYDPGEQYDYDNTFLSNLVQSQRQVNSSGNGALITVIDQASQKQYFTRNAQQQTIETTSDQDAYDQANWTLVKYKQPQLRVQQVVIDPASNPSAWPVALGVEQGDISRLIRRPLGGAVISQLCIVQMVSHAGGPDNWKTTINMVPYLTESAVLQCDAAGFDTAGSNSIGW